MFEKSPQKFPINSHFPMRHKNIFKHSGWQKHFHTFRLSLNWNFNGGLLFYFSKTSWRKTRTMMIVQRRSNFWCKTCYLSYNLFFGKQEEKIEGVSLETNYIGEDDVGKIVIFYYHPWPRNHVNKIINNSWTSFIQASIFEPYTGFFTFNS